MRRLGAQRPAAGYFLRSHRLAKQLEVGVANSVELHPDIKRGDGHKMGGVAVAARGERGPAFLQPCKNRKQLFV